MVKIERFIKYKLVFIFMGNKTISDMVADILAAGSIRKRHVDEHLAQLKNPFDTLDYLARIQTFINFGLKGAGIVSIETGVDSHLSGLQQQAIDAARQIAERDTLTGLYNRDTIDHLISRGGVPDERRTPGDRDAIMMFDIDRFKRINDAWGHVTGDTVILAVAEILQENLRESTIVEAIA